MQDLAGNPRRLGAQLGMLGVLHTWSRTLIFHPHIHYLIPGGGLSPDWPPVDRRPPEIPAAPSKPWALTSRTLFKARLQKAHPDLFAQVPRQGVAAPLERGQPRGWLGRERPALPRTLRVQDRDGQPRSAPRLPGGKLRWDYRESKTGTAHLAHAGAVGVDGALFATHPAAPFRPGANLRLAASGGQGARQPGAGVARPATGAHARRSAGGGTRRPNRRRNSPCHARAPRPPGQPVRRRRQGRTGHPPARHLRPMRSAVSALPQGDAAGGRMEARPGDALSQAQASPMSNPLCASRMELGQTRSRIAERRVLARSDGPRFIRVVAGVAASIGGLQLAI
ncbi:MAG: transposase [Desulfobacterales bacterium]|nr:transposase [Desulfobacterales bacterium]